MTLLDLDELVRSNLEYVLLELERQSNLAHCYPDERLSFKDEMLQIREYIGVGEYNLAYESILVNLEQVPFTVSGLAAIKLLEVGLVMGYKTERSEDQAFDMRK
jgi:hypothetical protein